MGVFSPWRSLAHLQLLSTIYLRQYKNPGHLSTRHQRIQSDYAVIPAGVVQVCSLLLCFPVSWFSVSLPAPGFIRAFPPYVIDACFLQGNLPIGLVTGILFFGSTSRSLCETHTNYAFVSWPRHDIYTSDDRRAKLTNTITFFKKLHFTLGSSLSFVFGSSSCFRS